MFRFIIVAIALTGCNSVYMKPGTLNPEETIYVDRGGYTMRRGIKQQMEKRRYNVVVGRTKSNRDNNGDSDITIDSTTIPKSAKYVVKISERQEKFRPIWCAFNGFWWWNFNVSIADQTSGKEILSWRGRGCEHSSLRKLDTILDELESK